MLTVKNQACTSQPLFQELDPGYMLELHQNKLNYAADKYILHIVYFYGN